MKRQTIQIQTTHLTNNPQVERDSLALPRLIQSSEAGQASIEFIITIMFTLGMTLLFIALALALGGMVAVISALLWPAKQLEDA